MKQINRLIEVIRREDENATISIPNYSNINTMNTETLIKVRTQLIRQLTCIAPSYPVKDLNLGNLQEIRSSSYTADRQLKDVDTQFV